MTHKQWIAAEIARMEAQQEQFRRERNRKIAAMLEAYHLAEDDLIEWIKERIAKD